MKRHEEVTVLLVEDDEVDQQAFRRALDELKINNPLINAKDGLEGLAVLRKNNGAKVKKPFLVVLDLNMPRMNGFEFLDEIRADEELQDAVIFVLTTSDDDKDVMKAYRPHVAGYVVKGDLAGSFKQAVQLLDFYWRLVVFPV